MAGWMRKKTPQDYALEGFVPTQEDLVWAKKQSERSERLAPAASEAIEQNNMWRLIWCTKVSYRGEFVLKGLTDEQRFTLFKEALEKNRLEMLKFIRLEYEGLHSLFQEYPAQQLKVVVHHAKRNVRALHNLNVYRGRPSLIQKMALNGHTDKLALLLPLMESFKDVKNLYNEVTKLNHNDSHAAILALLENRLDELKPRIACAIADNRNTGGNKAAPASASGARTLPAGVDTQMNEDWIRTGNLVTKKEHNPVLNGEVIKIADFENGRLITAFRDAKGVISTLDACDFADIQGPVVQQAQEALVKQGGTVPAITIHAQFKKE